MWKCYNKIQDGETPLTLSITGEHLDVVKMLIGQNADMSILDIVNIVYCFNCYDINQYGTTPLHKAVYRGFVAIAALLLEHGASVNERNEVSNYLSS